jgi:hypothetical protein
MAIGDDAAAAGFPLVPGSGDGGKVHDGYTEINRSRDLMAQTKALIPVGKPANRAASGISSGTADPTGGADGDIYFKIIG